MSDLVIIPNAPEICNKTAVQNCHACPDFNCGDNMVSKSNRAFYASGFAAALQQCREAVEKLLDDNLHAVSECALEEALAAIDKVEGE